MEVKLPTIPTSTALAETRFSGSLPLDIETHAAKLLKTGEDIQGFRRVSDGLIFGYVGLDAGLSLIPVVGSVYTVGGSLWLLVQAFRIRASLADKMWIVALAAIDAVVGVTGLASAGVTVVLDAALRVHAWTGARLLQHIDLHLSAIEGVRLQLAARSTPGSTNDPLIEELRDTLFRGGRTQVQNWIRMGIIAAGCALLLGYCEYRDGIRREQVAACEQRGGWFCSLKH
jgi:hypothetical protein